MNWAEFFQIIVDFVMRLVAFFKNTDNNENAKLVD